MYCIYYLCFNHNIKKDDGFVREISTGQGYNSDYILVISILVIHNNFLPTPFPI